MAGTIQTWINYVTQEFKSTFGVELWKKYPADQVAEIEDEVNNKDSFKSRVISLVALFDDLNKKVFDKATGESPTGSRLSLVAYLKSQLPDQHIQIDEAFKMVNMISLLRTHLAHSGNPGYKEAILFFGIAEPLTDHAISWASIKLKFELFLSDLSKLIATKNAIPLKQNELEATAIETAFRYTMLRHSYHLREYPLSRILLKEIAVRGTVTDVELAVTVGHPVKTIRELLLPFTSSFLRVSYATDSSTLLHMPEFRAELKNIEDWLTEKK